MRPKKKYRFTKVILWIISIILFNLLVLLGSLQIPAIQTELAQYLSRILSSKTGFNITLEAVDIDWLDKFNLEGVRVVDEREQELLSLKSLEVDYKLASLLRGNLRLDHVDINGLSMHLHKAEGDTLNLSRLINRIKKLSKAKKDTLQPGFTIDYISIVESNFSYENGHSSVEATSFNPKHFALTNINGKFKSLEIIADTFKIEVIKLTSVETNTGLKIENMQTDFQISSKQMRFDSLYVDIESSQVTNRLVFSYDSYDDLSYFIEKVKIEARLDKTILNTSDLQHFIPYFKNVHDTYVISGEFKGEISDYIFKNLNLTFGHGSKIAGSVYMSGLPDISETFLDIRFINSHLVENDIEQYVPTEGFKKYNRFKHVKLNGSFTGYVDDFVADGVFQTNLGTIISDINLKIAANQQETYYKGEIQLKEFDLGNYFDKNILGKATLQGQVEGYGMQPASANFSFDGAIDSLMLYDYNYSNITTSGKFQQEYFSGILKIDDPNLKLDTHGEIDLRNSANKIKISGELAYANLQNLKIEDDYAIIQSEIEVDFQGFHIDSIQGHLYLENFYAKQNDHELLIDNLTFNSERSENYRSAEIISDKVNIKISGDFEYTTAYRDLKFMATEFLLSLKNNKDSIKAFYDQQMVSAKTDPYEIKLTARISNIDKLVNLFEPNLQLHNTTKINLTYKHGNTSTMSCQFLNDSITYGGTTIINNNFNLDASKTIGKAQILAAADFQSQEQQLDNGSKLENLIISAVWADKLIDFNWYHTQQNINNVNDIYGEVHFYKDSTHIHLSKSNLSLLKEEWTIQENNSVTLTNELIKIRNLNISSQNQMLSVSGFVSKDPDKTLSVTAKNLDVGLINPMISKELSGRLSGEFTISTIYSSPTIVSDMYINNFAINQFLVGNIFSSNDWNNTTKLFDIKFVVNRDNTPVILVDGIFNPFDSQNALDLNASFMNARLDMSEPFIETLFSDLQGSITGNIHLTGSFVNPIISGNGSFNDARLKVNYLNTNYDVKGQWAFDSSAIYLNQLLLNDKNDNTATLGGKFTHQRLKNFRIDLSGEMNNFLVLNTSSGDNDLFYGTGITSGNLSITGPINDIIIAAQATTERGTKFFVPIGGSSSSEFEDYISFINFSDTLNLDLDKNEQSKMSGITLDFALDITEEAYAEIIFDITSGDIIRGKGNGHLNMKIDSQGEFTMIGSYEFVEGGYNFTMYNIINKEFIINPKSKITWSGDPYNGIMNIDAAYKLSTSLAPLVDTVYQDMPDVKRIYPTEVLLTLIGPLLTPDIEFQIIIDEYPKSNVDLDTQIKGFLNTIATDEQELNRQVFSLLIFRKFSRPNSFSSSGTLGSSVSEFVSNQLSYWISQVDENLTIDMDLGELDADALNTFQLRISYAFMDGKLIVTRDGGFTDPNNEASIGSIAGDWTLEYLLSEDGKLRVKVFNKTNYNQLNSSTGSDSQTLLTGGFSLIYTTSFDKLSDLFKHSKKKEKEKNLEPSSSGLKPEENHVDSK